MIARTGNERIEVSLADGFLGQLSVDERAAFVAQVVPVMPVAALLTAWSGKGLLKSQLSAGQLRIAKGEGALERRLEQGRRTLINLAATALLNHPMRLDLMSDYFATWSRRIATDEQPPQETQETPSWEMAMQLVQAQIVRSRELSLTPLPVLLDLWDEVLAATPATSGHASRKSASSRVAFRRRVDRVEQGIRERRNVHVSPDSFADQVDAVRDSLTAIIELQQQQGEQGTIGFPLRHLSLVYAMSLLDLIGHHREVRHHRLSLSLASISLSHGWLTLRRASQAR